MVTVVLNSNARLTYALMTTPTPVTVSPASGPPSLATLTFVVSAPTQDGPAILVKRIAFTLPVGGEAIHLTEDAGGILGSAISSGTDRWQVGPGAAPGVFVVRPAGEQPIEIDDQALTITFTNVAVSRRVGTARVKIAETSGDEPAKLEIAVAKFPGGFYAFDFTAGVPQVGSGQRATLKWVASANAHCTILYGSAPPVDVSKVRAWTSPPLYGITVFVLHASAIEGGETVSLDHTATVAVAAPEIVQFSAVPDALDYDQPVELRWRSIDADGVYLRLGQSAKETLPAISDPARPKSIRPRYGDEYTLQAFKNQRDESPILSSVHPLALTFNALDIKGFAADPPAVDLARTSTRISWEVAHAKSVTLQGALVAAKGSKDEHPQANTTYELAATWVDGQVTKRSVEVKRRRLTFHGVVAICTVIRNTIPNRPDVGTFRLRVTFTVENATGGSSILIPGFVGKLTVWGAALWTRTSDTTWEFSQDYPETPVAWISEPVSFMVSSVINGIRDDPNEQLDDKRSFKITPKS